MRAAAARAAAGVQQRRAAAASGSGGSGSGGGSSATDGVGAPFEMVSAGLHWLCKMSRQMLPLLFTLQW